MIYLDNAATTFPKPEEVYVAMDEFNRNYAVNAGRGAYAAARSVSTLINDTKSILRDLINADISSSVVFSPSITIALNQIINGLDLKVNDIVYVSPYEHNAVARTLNSVSKNKKIIVKELPINEETLEIDIEKTKYLFANEKPKAIFCTHVSNVTGYILPVEEIFAIGRVYGSINVLDTAQSLGLLPIDIKKLDVDFVAFTGHKTLYGPIGIGGFVNVNNYILGDYIIGGTGSDSLNLEMPSSMESRYEAASMNGSAVAGLNAALSILSQNTIYAKEKELTSYLINELNKLNFIKIYLPSDLDKHIGVVSITMEDYTSEDAGTILDEEFNIAVRTGYHCAPYIHKYLNDYASLGTIRVGISQFSTKNDIDGFISALKELRV